MTSTQNTPFDNDYQPRFISRAIDGTGINSVENDAAMACVCNNVKITFELKKPTGIGKTSVLQSVSAGFVIEVLT